MSLLIHLIVAIAAANAGPEIIAHRGESFDAPENTLAAFQLAWERKVGAIELDVHLTKDGRLIICHDPDTERVSGKKEVIATTNLEDLRKLDAGAWKDARWKGEKMPTLEEALSTIPDQGRCFIEIKVGPEAVPAVANAIKNSGKRPDQLVIISFKAPTVAEAKRRLPQIKSYFLSGFKKNKQTGVWSPTVDELIQQAKAVHADGLDLSHEGPIDEAAIKRIKDSGLQFFVWTVDEIAVARKFAAWGAEGITTNRAAWMASELSK